MDVANHLISGHNLLNINRNFAFYPLTISFIPILYLLSLLITFIMYKYNCYFCDVLSIIFQEKTPKHEDILTFFLDRKFPKIDIQNRYVNQA